MKINEIIEEYEPYKNTLVIYLFNIVRFIDFCYDKGDDEYYYIIEYDGKIEKVSVLYKLIPLKSEFTPETYDTMKKLWNNNNNIKVN